MSHSRASTCCAMVYLSMREKDRVMKVVVVDVTQMVVIAINTPSPAGHLAWWWSGIRLGGEGVFLIVAPS